MHCDLHCAVRGTRHTAAPRHVSPNPSSPAGHSQCNPCKDGGVVDRVGLRAWRDRRRAQLKERGLSPSGVPPALVHVISRSSPFSGFDDVSSCGEANVSVVHSPKAGANFLSLGDFERHMSASRLRARPVLVEAMGSTPATNAMSAATRSDQRSPERKRFVSA